MVMKGTDYLHIRDTSTLKMKYKISPRNSHVRQAIYRTTDSIILMFLVILRLSKVYLFCEFGVITSTMNQTFAILKRLSYCHQHQINCFSAWASRRKSDIGFFQSYLPFRIPFHPTHKPSTHPNTGAQCHLQTVQDKADSIKRTLWIIK